MPANSKFAALVLEDDQDQCAQVARILRSAGFADVSECERVTEALEVIDRLVSEERLALLVADLQVPSKTGHEFGGWSVVTYAKEKAPNAALAVFTAHFENFTDAVNAASRYPDFHLFFKKDANWKQKIKDWAEQQLERFSAGRQPVLADKETKRIWAELAPIYAPTQLPILVVGETGVGKEDLARKIHEESNTGGRFRGVNCGALTDNLAMNELFGHSMGAFTDATDYRLGLFLEASGYNVPDEKSRKTLRNEKAVFIDWLKAGNKGLVAPKSDDGLWELPADKQRFGTLFLDEIASLPPRAMAGVLRALEGDIRPLGHSGHGIRCYCRIVAATNEMEKLEKGDSFRQDLLYRLSGVVLRLLPVWQRGKSTIEEFVKSNAVWNKVKVFPSGKPLDKMAVEGAAIDRMWAVYDHPADKHEENIRRGNFRTLQNLLHRAALLARGGGSPAITVEHIEQALEHGYVRVEDSDEGGGEVRSRGVVKPVDQAIQLAGITKKIKQPVSFVLKQLLEALKQNPKAPRELHVEREKIKTAFNGDRTIDNFMTNSEDSNKAVSGLKSQGYTVTFSSKGIYVKINDGWSISEEVVQIAECRD